MAETTWLDAFVGEEFDFFGVDGHAFKLDGNVFEAVEDPDDGYRSYLETIELSTKEGLIFFPSPVARVRVEVERLEDTDFWGYKLVDVADGHVWLTVGTDHSEDYYPMFTFRYEAKPRYQEKVLWQQGVIDGNDNWDYWQLVRRDFEGLRVRHDSYVEWPVLLPGGRVKFADYFFNGERSAPNINEIVPPAVRNAVLQELTKQQVPA